MIKDFGGIDLQLLGIGLDGHIGFNEPDSFFTKETHEVILDESTIKANARFFASIDEVPTHAYTMGVGNIMSAKKVLLLASGESKAQAVLDSFYGPITPQVPASILQLHEDCVVIATQSGDIKRVPATAFKTQNRNTKGIKTADDAILDMISTNTIDTLMFFTDKGKMYRLLVDKVPVGTKASKGGRIGALINLEADEKVVAMKNHVYRITAANEEADRAANTAITNV